MITDQTSVETAAKGPLGVFDRCQSVLQTHGFLDHTHTTIWRRTNIKLDVVKFDIISRGRCAKWKVPVGSMGLAVSCLFPFLPRLGHSPSDGQRPDKGFGQIRLSFNRRATQPSIRIPNIWWPGNDAQTFETIVADVLTNLEEKALPFFGRFEDPKEVLRTFMEDEDAIGSEGVWEFGKIGSPHRLLNTGFAALECGQVELAISSLEECRRRISAIPTSVGDRIRSEMTPYIDQGIAAAKAHRRWPTEL